MRYLASKFSGTKAAQHPLPDEFAIDLANLFAGAPLVPQRPVDLTETPWTLEELLKTLQRMKLNKAADENGLVAELLKYAPIEYLELLLSSFNTVLFPWQHAVNLAQDNLQNVSQMFESQSDS